MSGFVAIVQWNQVPVTENLVRRFLNPIQHRGQDGVHIHTQANFGLGYAYTRSRYDEKPLKFPISNPAQTQFVVLNGYLFNGAELRQQLGQSTSDFGALILAAYARWGTDCVHYLDGDFAFVIWDTAQQTAFAARDMFGAKPLYYHVDAEKIIFASEPKQILAHPTISADVDDLIVGEYLFQNFRDMNRTFFAQVQRVQAAHWLKATSTQIQQVRHWNPDPTLEIHYVNRQDYYERFRELLMQAVEKRLETTTYPAFMDLSGGHDSSSVVVMAQRLAEQNSGHLPTLATVSGSFLGVDADETQYFQPLQSRLPFASHTIEPINFAWSLDDLTADFWQIDSPFVDMQRGMFEQKRRLMQTHAARLLLTGLGGDEVIHAEYYLRDIATRLKFGLLWQETRQASQTSANSFSSLLFDSLKALIPHAPKLALRKLRGTDKPQLPFWITQSYRQQYLQFPPSPPLSYADFPSLTQEIAFQYANYPGIMWVFEMLELQNAQDGIQVAHPILDKTLVNFILSIPFEKRIPAGHWKDLFQRGLADDLPPEILNRRYKTRFDSFNQHIIRTLLPDAQKTLFGDDVWASARFIKPDAVKELFEQYRHDENIVLTETLWRIITLELWMRQLHRYEAL